MISENREFSEKKGVSCVSVVGRGGVCGVVVVGGSFYTNSGSELEGAVPRFY